MHRILYLAILLTSLSGVSSIASTPCTATWPLTDPGLDGTGQTVMTSGPITAVDQSFSAMRINGYSGAEQSQRSDNRPPGGASQWPPGRTTRMDSVFVQFAVAPLSGTTLKITHLSFEIGGNSTHYFKADVLYSTDSTFTTFESIPDSLILEGEDYSYPGYLLRADSLNPVSFDLNQSVAENNTFYLRVYPWVHNRMSGLTGKYLLLKNVVISGVAEGQAVYDLADIRTAEVSYLPTTFATSGGTITSDGGAAVTARGVVWNTSGSPTTADNKTVDGEGPGEFTSKITRLDPGDTYYLRAYATNQAGTAYGAEKKFTTLDSVTVPTVFTGDVGNIRAHSAECRSYVIDWGGDSVSVRGVVWNTTGSPTLADSASQDGAGQGQYNSYLYPLKPSTTYYVRAYAMNSAGVGYGRTLDFTTRAPQPDVIKIVDQDGHGDYTTVQAAFDDVPDSYTGRWKIKINSGVYYEKLFLDRDKVNVLLEGAHPDSVILTYDDYAGKAGGTSKSYSVAIEPDDFIARNLTFQNTVVNDGSVKDQQAVALRVNGDRQCYYNCKLLGYQDTYYTWGGRGTGRTYMKNCTIEGSVDFIFGRNIVLFDSCTIHINRDGSCVTAAATSEKAEFGYVFRDCIISHDEIGFDGKTIDNVFLGRPWQDAPRTVFIRTLEPAALNPIGWRSWNVLPALYAEYQCYGPGSDTSIRSMISRQLTDEEAKDYTLENIFSKASFPDFTNDWIPEPMLDVTGVKQEDNRGSVPEPFDLGANYPNPFNPLTTIVYHLPRREQVSLEIYNTLGQQVRVLVDKNQSAGAQHIKWDGRDQTGHRLAAGVYLCRLQVGNYIAMRKLCLVK